MKCIIDVDTGVDDAHAIALAVASPDELNIIGISCVAGNGPVDLVTTATLQVLEACNASQINVHKGCSKPLVEEPHPCPFIHGKNCLGDLSLPHPSIKPSGIHAVTWLLETCRLSDEPICIVALAPLTNIAVAFRLEPNLMLQKIQEIHWMGGAFRAGGNYGAWTEANAGYDPEAAHIILTSGIPLIMYPWDLYTSVELSRSQVIKHDPEMRQLSSRLLIRDLNHWSMEKAMIGDAITVACLVDPSLVLESQSYPVSIELSAGKTRGMTVFDQRLQVDPPDIPKAANNATVVTKVDVERLQNLFISRVLNRGL